MWKKTFGLTMILMLLTNCKLTDSDPSDVNEANLTSEIQAQNANQGLKQIIDKNNLIYQKVKNAACLLTKVTQGATYSCALAFAVFAGGVFAIDQVSAYNEKQGALEFQYPYRQRPTALQWVVFISASLAGLKTLGGNVFGLTIEPAREKLINFLMKTYNRKAIQDAENLKEFIASSNLSQQDQKLLIDNIVVFKVFRVDFNRFRIELDYLNGDKIVLLADKKRVALDGDNILEIEGINVKQDFPQDYTYIGKIQNDTLLHSGLYEKKKYRYNYSPKKATRHLDFLVFYFALDAAAKSILAQDYFDSWTKDLLSKNGVPLLKSPEIMMISQDSCKKDLPLLGNKIESELDNRFCAPQ